MKFQFNVGTTGRHKVRFRYSRLVNTVRIDVDGDLVKRDVFWLWIPAYRRYEFEAGQPEKHDVVIETSIPRVGARLINPSCSVTVDENLPLNIKTDSLSLGGGEHGGEHRELRVRSTDSPVHRLRPGCPSPAASTRCSPPPRAAGHRLPRQWVTHLGADALPTWQQAPILAVSIPWQEKQLMRKQGVKFTALIRLAAMFASCGLALTALGVASLLNAIRGGLALGILALVIAVGTFVLAGYFVWGYGWLRKRPELSRKAERE